MDVLKRLNEREKNILYLLTIVILLSLSYTFLVEPVFKSYGKLSREMVLVKAKLERYLSIIKQKDKIDKEYAAYLERLKLIGSDEQELTSILNTLEVLARNANLKIVNMKPKPPQEKEFYKRFTVEIDAESDMRSLMKFIYDVKNSQQLLKIDRLSMSSKSAETGVIIRASMVISSMKVSKS